MAFFATSLLILLQLSATWAAPASESTKTISIPVADIANGTLGRHEGHPVFPLYLHWLETSVHGSWVARNAKAGNLATEPHLTSIDCNLERGNCHFVSTFQLDEVVGLPIDLALGFENTRKDALGQSEGDALLGKRDATTQSWSADHLYTETHFKTYHDIDDHHAGFEHYVAWNIFCNTLSYSSPGFVAQSHDIHKDHSNQFQNQVITKLAAGDVNTQNANILVTLHQTFACGIFTNRCCTTDWWTAVTRGGKDDVFAGTSTQECNTGRQVSSC